MVDYKTFIKRIAAIQRKLMEAFEQTGIAFNTLHALRSITDHLMVEVFEVLKTCKDSSRDECVDEVIDLGFLLTEILNSTSDVIGSQCIELDSLNKVNIDNAKVMNVIEKLIELGYAVGRAREGLGMVHNPWKRDVDEKRFCSEMTRAMKLYIELLIALDVSQEMFVKK